MQKTVPSVLVAFVRGAPGHYSGTTTAPHPGGYSLAVLVFPDAMVVAVSGILDQKTSSPSETDARRPFPTMIVVP